MRAWDQQEPSLFPHPPQKKERWKGGEEQRWQITLAALRPDASARLRPRLNMLRRVGLAQTERRLYGRRIDELRADQRMRDSGLQRRLSCSYFSRCLPVPESRDKSGLCGREKLYCRDTPTLSLLHHLFFLIFFFPLYPPRSPHSRIFAGRWPRYVLESKTGLQHQDKWGFDRPPNGPPPSCCSPPGSSEGLMCYERGKVKSPGCVCLRDCTMKACSRIYHQRHPPRQASLPYGRWLPRALRQSPDGR